MHHRYVGTLFITATLQQSCTETDVNAHLAAQQQPELVQAECPLSDLWLGYIRQKVRGRIIVVYWHTRL